MGPEQAGDKLVRTSELTFLGGAYLGTKKVISAQECVNFYLEVPPKEAVGARSALIGTPGLDLWVDLGTSAEVRGVLATEACLYAVSGATLFSVTSAGVATSLGTLLSATGYVGMAYSGSQLIVVDGSYGYTYTESTTTFARITDADFLGGDTVVFIDGYFIVNEPGSDQFCVSGLYDGTAWDALDRASAEGSPDALVAVATKHRELWLFGSRTTEVWYNSGNVQGAPFDRISGAFLEIGCAAKGSVVMADNNLFVLAATAQGAGMVYRTEGYSPKRISTSAIESAIAGYSTISDARAWAYQESGHTFYVINFPTADKTWAYDVSTGYWHERRSRKTVGGLSYDGRHRAQCGAYFAGKQIVGDYESGELFQQSLSFFDDDGAAITRIRTGQTVSDNQNEVFYSGLHVLFEPGPGTGSGQGLNPQAVMQTSKDGGHTWSNEMWADVGRMGEYHQRAAWRRLGAGRNTVFKLTVSDPVPWVIAGAFASAQTEI